jgi:excisionase family DNA binding protein
MIMIQIEDQDQFVTASEAAQVLGAKHVTVSQLCQSGRLPAVKIANRWLIRKDVLEEFAKTYVPKVGRPRTKRKYTKRSPKWSQ